MDPAAPDLYVPLTAVWAYTLLVCVAALLRGKFSPDMMYATVGSGLCRLTFMRYGGGLCVHVLGYM